MAVTSRVDTGRAWVATALLGLVALVGGSALFTGPVYRGFVWQYFWGPVYADAHNAVCAVNSGGAVELLYSTSDCGAAVRQGLVVAEPGYTLVSEVGYMVVLLFMLVGVLQLLRTLDVGGERELLPALVPFMLFGGALRVVEDANDATPEGVPQAIEYPLNSLIISPLIYFTVFVVTLGALLAALWLYRQGYASSYTRPLAVMGSGVMLLTAAYLGWLAVTTDFVALHLQVLTVVVVIASALAVGIWTTVERWEPSVNAGTKQLGIVVLWAHAIDGVANVVASDWLGALGVNLTYTPKHPANAFIISLTETVVPQSILAAAGSSWPFLLVKLAVALGVVWIFDAEIFEESPRYAVLLLVAIVAVGLGPGTRDVVRATLGI